MKKNFLFLSIVGLLLSSCSSSDDNSSNGSGTGDNITKVAINFDNTNIPSDVSQLRVLINSSIDGKLISSFDLTKGGSKVVDFPSGYAAKDYYISYYYESSTTQNGYPFLTTFQSSLTNVSLNMPLGNSPKASTKFENIVLSIKNLPSNYNVKPTISRDVKYGVPVDKTSFSIDYSCDNFYVIAYETTTKTSKYIKLAAPTAENQLYTVDFNNFTTGNLSTTDILSYDGYDVYGLENNDYYDLFLFRQYQQMPQYKMGVNGNVFYPTDSGLSYITRFHNRSDVADQKNWDYTYEKISSTPNKEFKNYTFTLNSYNYKNKSINISGSYDFYQVSYSINGAPDWRVTTDDISKVKNIEIPTDLQSKFKKDLYTYISNSSDSNNELFIYDISTVKGYQEFVNDLLSTTPYPSKKINSKNMEVFYLAST